MTPDGLKGTEVSFVPLLGTSESGDRFRGKPPTRWGKSSDPSWIPENVASEPNLSHTQNPELKWSTPNHASRIKKAGILSYLWQGDCPPLTFIYPVGGLIVAQIGSLQNGIRTKWHQSPGFEHLASTWPRCPRCLAAKWPPAAPPAPSTAGPTAGWTARWAANATPAPGVERRGTLPPANMEVHSPL